MKPGNRRKPLLVLLALVLIASGTWGYLTFVSGDTGDLPDVNDVSAADAQQQSTLVDQEDLRVMQTRAALTSALARGGPNAAAARQPHISSSANGRTLVLPQRGEPYRVSDLEALGGEDFQKQTDGSYVLNINVFIGPGARLVLQNATGPLVLRMRSEPGAFTSIVGFGADIRINGSAQNPVHLTSWNSREQKEDTKVADGRAYIRVVGGALKMSHARVEHLGFWSGRTGGLSMTGSDRSSEGAEQVPGTQAQGQKLLSPDGRSRAQRGGDTVVEIMDGSGGRKVSYQMPEANLVTGSIEDSTIVGNAYGIFITGSNETRIRATTVQDSLVNGVLLHRFARNATIENTTVTRSRGDGFVLSRATQNVKISGSTAEENGGNGFTLSGLPLAQAASASGESLRSFGDSSVTSSVARDNERYGMEIQGGVRLSVQTSEVVGGEAGIVVSKEARDVQISGNRLSGQSEQGISLRDGVRSAKISGNIVRNTRVAIHLRDSRATITGNTVQSVSLHGLTLIGQAEGTRITGNTLGGAGRSAIDSDRVLGAVTIAGNNTDGWQETAGFWTMVKRIAKPMNIIWAVVFGVVLVSAFRSRGLGPRIGRRGIDPYSLQKAMEERPVRRLKAAADTEAEPARVSSGTDRS
ncbi:NosD domain-containing protein [Actinocorallia sp. B10E7]|uniref:NosD domain-containing protein n=1 Tax=Actinocorallia sp. B10E7 TaxID=3153558 RepID=UPI00325EFCE8